MTSAAPIPCTARAAISQPVPGASVQATDAAANRPRPVANVRRRPSPVTQRSRGHQEHGEAEDVGVHRPLELLDRGAEVQPIGLPLVSMRVLLIRGAALLVVETPPATETERTGKVPEGRSARA
jgi:hypothetical protein